MGEKLYLSAYVSKLGEDMGIAMTDHRAEYLSLRREKKGTWYPLREGEGSNKKEAIVDLWSNMILDAHFMMRKDDLDWFIPALNQKLAEKIEKRNK
jgi:hypothetical protein